MSDDDKKSDPKIDAVNALFDAAVDAAIALGVDCDDVMRVVVGSMFAHYRWAHDMSIPDTLAAMDEALREYKQGVITAMQEEEQERDDSKSKAKPGSKPS
jgi:hypothetical protein